MAGIFNPTPPKMPKPVELPTVDQTLIDRQAQDLARRRRSRAQSTVAGDTGIPSSALASKQLLGG